MKTKLKIQFFREREQEIELPFYFMEHIGDSIKTYFRVYEKDDKTEVDTVLDATRCKTMNYSGGLIFSGNLPSGGELITVEEYKASFEKFVDYITAKGEEVLVEVSQPLV